MATKIIKGYRQLLEEAEAVARTISVDEAKELLGSEEHVFVDIRDIREVQREGCIPGAHICPRGMLEFWIDPDCKYHKPLFAEQKTFVLYCASAWRSALAAKMVMEMGLDPVVHLAGGFTAWKDAGLEIYRREAKPKG